MKGRTNISGGGMNINADTENFTVANGSNVTAGNFVQYKLEPSDKKYDTNSGYGDSFYDSGNEAPKVLPCGNNKYVRRYKNNGETNIFWFNLIDVSNGFKVLSSFSISSTNLPSFCLLDDGNVAVCYMTQDNTFTVRIYSIQTVFLLLNTFELTNENIGEIGATHIAQIGNSKIIISRMNKLLVCNYASGTIAEDFYAELDSSYIYNDTYTLSPVLYGDNDWNLYPVELDKFFIFPTYMHHTSTMTYTAYICELMQIEGNDAKKIDKTIVLKTNNGQPSSQLRYERFYLNGALWGNAYGIGGKILFSQGCINNTGTSNDFFLTRIYYAQDNYIMQTSNLDLLELSKSAFSDLPSDVTNGSYSSSASGTAQYVKENVFYVSLQPLGRPGNGQNPKSRAAIYRVEYSPENGIFTQSNIVTFEGDAQNYNFGYGQFFESEDGDIYYLYETRASGNYAKTGRWLMKLTYKNGILEIGENTGMVENYTGSGAAIGVAKQSGKAGDIIEVYTPKP